MPKSLIRIVSIVLIPILTADPSTAASFSFFNADVQSRPILRVVPFESQALTLMLLAAAFVGTSWHPHEPVLVQTSGLVRSLTSKKKRGTRKQNKVSTFSDVGTASGISAEEGKRRIIDFVEALVFRETKTFSTMELQHLAARIKPFIVPLGARGYLYIGKVHKNDVDLFFSSLPPGTQARVTPEMAHPDDALTVRLRVEAGGKTRYFGFKSEPGYLLDITRQIEVPEMSALCDFIRSMDQPAELAKLGPKLTPIRVSPDKNGRIYFGRIQNYGIELTLRNMGNQVEIIPVANDPADWSLGIRLKVISGDFVREYAVINKPPFVTNQARVDRASEVVHIKNYVQTLFDGRDLSTAAQALQPFQWLAGRRLDFGRPGPASKEVIGVVVPEFENGARIQVTPHLLDPSDPSQGAYLQLEADGKSVDVDFSRTSPFLTLRNKKVNHLGQLLNHVRAVVEGQEHNVAMNELRAVHARVRGGSLELGQIENHSVRIPLPMIKDPDLVYVKFRRRHPGDEKSPWIVEVVWRRHHHYYFQIEPRPPFLGQIDVAEESIEAVRSAKNAELSEARQAYARYLKAYLQKESLSAAARALPPMTFVTPESGIVFLSSWKSHTLKLSFRGMPAGTEASVIPHFIVEGKPENGVYLEVIAGSDVRCFTFKPTGFCLENSTAKFRTPAVARFIDYVQALQSGQNVAESAAHLEEFNIVTSPSRYAYLGRIGKKNVQIWLLDLPPNTPVHVIPRSFVPDDPLKGIYLQCESGGKIWFRAVEAKAGFFTSISDPREYFGLKQVRAYLDVLTEKSSKIKAMPDLVKFTLPVAEDGRLNFFRYDDVNVKTSFSNPSTRLAQVTPRPWDAKDSARGAYLEISVGDRMRCFELIGDRPYLRDVSSEVTRPGEKAVREYLTALMRQENLSVASQALMAFTSVTGKKSELYFGRLEGTVGISLDGWGPDCSVQLTPILNDPADLSRGAYLQLDSVHGRRYYEFKMPPGYFRNITWEMEHPERAAFIRYVQAVKNGESLQDVVRHLNTFKLNQTKGGSLVFGPLEGKSLVLSGLPLLKGTDEVTVKPVLHTLNDPSKGAFIQINAGERQWLYRIVPEPNYFVQMSKVGPGKAKTEYQKAVGFLEKYNVLDVAISLAPYPDEMQQALMILLTGQGVKLDEQVFGRLSRAFLAGDDPAGPGTGGVPPGQSDDLAYLRALMKLQEVIAHLNEHEQLVLIRAFERLAFLSFARNYEQAMQNTVTTLSESPQTEFLQSLLIRLKEVFGQGLQFQPAHIVTTMKPHQRVGAWYMRRSDQYQEDGQYGFLLEDDTRLGKTIQTYAALDPTWRAIIAVPAGVMEEWRRQYKYHTNQQMKFIIVRGTPTEKRHLLAEIRGQKGIILLMSIEDMRAYSPGELEQVSENTDVVIIDEGQRIENYGGHLLRSSSQQARALHRLKARRKWVLSATPYTSHPRQLFSVFNLLHRNPDTNQVSNALFESRRAFSRFLSQSFSRMRWLYSLKARIGLRRTKLELGGLYSRKKEIDPEQEGQYEVSMEQARLELKIMKNLKAYVSVYNRRVTPEDRIQEKSLGSLLKLQFLNWALTDPTILGEEIPTTYWSAMDERVLPRVSAGKKGIILAQNTIMIDRIIARYEKEGIKVARIDGTVTGYAIDEQGRTLLFNDTNDGRLVRDPKGFPVSAQAYQRHRFQDDPDIQLIVINVRAGVGLDLSAAEWELYAQLPDNYVQYHQSSDRALGLNPPGRMKEVETLFMMPVYPTAFVEAAGRTGDDRYVDGGTPSQIIYRSIMGEDKARYEIVQEGMNNERGMTDEKAITRLVHSIYGFLEDPSLAGKKTKQHRELESSNAFYPVYRLVRGDKGQEDAVLTLVQNYVKVNVSAIPLVLELVKHKSVSTEIWTSLNAMFDIPNKFQRDQIISWLPDILNAAWKEDDRIAGLWQRGPPALQQLANSLPSLYLPFVAASHAWRAQSDDEEVLQPEHPGSQVLIQILEEFFNDGFSDYDRSLWLKRWIGSLIPLINPNDERFLNFLAHMQDDLLNEGVSLEARIRFFEELAVLKQSDEEAFNEILATSRGYNLTQVALRDLLRRSMVRMFGLPVDDHTQDRLLEIALQWGSLEAPLQLMAKLRSGDPRQYREAIELYQKVIKHIVADDYDVWRNLQFEDPTGHEVAYKNDDPHFWDVFTRDEEVELGQVTIQPKELVRARSRKMELLADRLSDKRALRDAFGALSDVLEKDLLKPNESLVSLQTAIKEKGRQRHMLEREAGKGPGFQNAIETVNQQLTNLRLRQALLQTQQLLRIEDADIDTLSRLLKRIGTAVRQVDLTLEPEPYIAESLRELSATLEIEATPRRFNQVIVELTSDPHLIMRRGMLHEDMKNCFNLNANVAQISTLVDDLASRNKMLALVRSDGTIIAVAMVKVRRTEKGEPVLMIERPLSRRGYGFEREIAQALQMTKLPEIPGTAVAADVRTTEPQGDPVELYNTGGRGPNEYYEAMFSIRRRDLSVHHKANVLITATTTPAAEDLTSEGVTRVALRLQGTLHEVVGVGHSNRNIGDFIALLKRAGIQTLVDVRTNPMSQYNPHFNRRALEAILTQHGITYRWEGEYLGGKLPEYRGDFRKYMQEDHEGRFSKGIARLLDIVRTEKNPVGLLCSEKAVKDCHRQYILDYLQNNYGEPNIPSSNKSDQPGLFGEDPGAGSWFKTRTGWYEHLVAPWFEPLVSLGIPSMVAWLVEGQMHSNGMTSARLMVLLPAGVALISTLLFRYPHKWFQGKAVFNSQPVRELTWETAGVGLLIGAAMVAPTSMGLAGLVLLISAASAAVAALLVRHSAINNRQSLDRIFGNTGLKFFSLGLGSLWFGRRWPPGSTTWVMPSNEDVEKQILTSFDRMASSEGVVHIDTARSYGETEQRIGEFFKKFKSLRTRAFIATKWGESYNPEVDKGTLVYTLQNLRESFKLSKSYLGAIDLYYIHMPGSATIDALSKDIRQEMKAMKERGDVKYLGASISNDQLLALALKEGLLDDFDVIQMPADVIAKRPDIIEELHRRGKAIVLNSPIRSLKFPEGTKEEAKQAAYQERYRELLSHPGVSLILVGTQNNLNRTIGYVSLPSSPQTNQALWRKLMSLFTRKPRGTASTFHRIETAA